MLPENFQDRQVCIIGLGYVGLTLAVAMADIGFRVYGVEKRKDVVDDLCQGKPQFWEQGLEPKLKRVLDEGRLSVHNTLSSDFSASTYIITVGTPLNGDGEARLDMVVAAAREVAEHMQDDALVILRSTVKLGTGRNVVSPVLAEAGKKFQIAACPERTLEGRALTELFELPQIIGADDRETALRASQIFQFLTPTILRVSSLESAEMIKLVDNTYRDVTFSFANEIARLCQAVGIDAQEVIRSGKLGYPRTNVAWPGPVGGPCLEKDPHILCESARSYGVELDVTAAGRRVNEAMPREVAELLAKTVVDIGGSKSALRIALLGWAFKGKPATDDLRGTMAIPIYRELRVAFPEATFFGYDPVVDANKVEELGVNSVASITEAFDGADMVVLMNNHAAFESMPLEGLMATMRRPSIVFDFWNSYSNADPNLPKGAVYMGLGGALHANLELSEAATT